MLIRSQNPYTLDTNFEVETWSELQITNTIEIAHGAFLLWKQKTIQERADIIKNLSQIMTQQLQELAELDTKEMGMPIKEALGDVKKSASNIEYFCDNAAKLLQEKQVSDGKMNARIVYEPLGVLFSIMPWNYPFNQVLRSVIPNLLAGNVVIMKHASNVPLVAKKLEEIFLAA